MEAALRRAHVPYQSYSSSASGGYGGGSAWGTRTATTPYGGTYQASGSSSYRPPGW
jgi:hypothetical protein